MLKIEGLSFSYSETPVLQNLSYSFKPSSVYALMGANGSGKTTLFNIISGFLQAQKGKVYFGENHIDSLPAHERANLGLARTFQDLRLFPSLTVEQNLLLAIQNKPGEKIHSSFFRSEHATYDERIEKVLQTCHLFEVRSQKAEHISYGQQKLLNLGCSIINDSKLLLLDEPVAGVQPKYREQIAELIAAMDKTVIVIEHNPDFIQSITDTVLFLNGGNIIAEGTYEQIKQNPDVQEAYL